MLIINFDKNELCKKAYGLWQYDYGQVLRIQGLNLPTAAEIHFALQETGGEAVTRIGITKDGVTDVTIPDSLLEADGASQDYQIYVFVYLATPDSGETTRRITLGVKSRPRPEAFNTPGEGELFEEAIQAVNDAAKRAEDAGKEATAAAGKARESASQAGKHLENTRTLAEQVEINADAVTQGTETARELLAQTQSVASNAALSAETAKQSETAAKQAQTAAETAEDTARQYAEETEADRREVAESKQSVEQMQSNVARMQAEVQADREAVEQTVSEFGQTAQDALTAIGQARNTAVSSVTEEGRKQATAVRETGTQAVNEVETAKTAAVEAVTSEGDVQVGKVQEIAAEIAADREQIQQNKTDITTLTNKTNTLAPGIVLDAKGETVAVHNASEQPLVGLNVYGKSEQFKTTGAQLYNPALWDALIERPDVKIVNHMDGSFEVSGSELTSTLSYSHVYTHEETLDMFSVGDNVYIVANDTKIGIWFNILFVKNGVNYSPKNGLTQEDLSDPTLKARQVIFGNTGSKIIPGLVRPMLSKIKDADWEPYTGGKPSPSLEYQQDIVNAGDAGEINVSICGKNLLTGRKYYGEYTIGKAFIANLNDEVVLPYEPSHSTKGICYAIDCVAGKTYTFSVSNSNPNGTLRIAEYANLNDALNYRKVISYANATAENAFINYTAKGKGVIVCLIAGKWTESNNLTHNCTESELLQLELGSTATPYEPPKPAQTLTLSTPNGLAGIPVKSGGNYVDENGQQWITDEVDLEKGERVQRIGKHTFGDTDRFSYLYDEKYDLSRFSWLDYIEMAEIDTPVMYGKMRYVGTGATEENVIKGSSGFSRCYMYVNTSINTVEKFKEIIAGSEIIYVLSNPIRTPLTPEEIATYKSLHTYSGTTVVTNDSNAGMSLTYTVDTKKYVDEKIAAISAAMIGG